MRLVLASASPRRAELLASAGYTFDVRPVEVDERVLSGEEAAAYVRRLAIEKAARAASLFGTERIVLAADTAVVLQGEILGKPRDDRDAERMLRALSGRVHEVMTGVSLQTRDVRLDDVETTRVWFAELRAADVAWYIASGEGRDKAGAYGIQGLAARFIPRIDGSYSNVVGLPISLVHEMLTRLT
jgi:septum formation protein